MIEKFVLGFFLGIRFAVGITNVALDTHVLSEHRIQLFRYVIFFVADSFRPQLQHYVRIGLAVDVHRMEVVGFHDVHPDQHVDGIVRGQALKEPVLRVEPHYGVVVDVFRQRKFVHFYRTLQNTINGRLITNRQQAVGRSSTVDHNE